MARKCRISKVGRQSGHRVSHANNKTKRAFEVNLQTKRIFVSEIGKFVRVKLSTRVLRTIDKLGFTATLKKYNLTIKDITA